jgi:hypothetical protein
MKPQRLIFNPFLIVAVLFILAVSVAPAMAADANSRYMSSFSAGSAGQGNPVSHAGGGKHPLTQKNTAGISAGSQVTSLGASSGTGDSAGNVDTARKNLPWWAWLIFAILIVLLIVATAGAAGAFGAAGAGAAAGGVAVGTQAGMPYTYVPNPVFPPQGPIVGPPMPPGH